MVDFAATMRASDDGVGSGRATTTLPISGIVHV